MLSFEPDIARGKVPAIVVCGIDRRTRTETIERILATGRTRWAVVSNEIEGPDFASAATERIAGRMVPHAIGCLCCVIRSGLVSSLRRLFALRGQGEADFDQVVIEMLPDDDPAPVMQTLLNNALVTEYFRLDSVVVAMAADGFTSLAASQYGFKQLAVADRIVLDPAALGEIGMHDRIGRLNPAAALLGSDHAELSKAVLGAGLEACLLQGDLGGWLAQAHYADLDGLEQGLHGFAIEFDAPLDWDAFHGWLNAGTQSNGDFMYRTKGAILVDGFKGPVVINGAQHVYQPPHLLPDTAIDRSHLLFITDDLDRAAVEHSLRNDLPQFGDSVRLAPRAQPAQRWTPRFLSRCRRLPRVWPVVAPISPASGGDAPCL